MTNVSGVLDLGWHRGFRAFLGGVVVITIFAWALPRFARYQDVWPQLRALDGSVAIPLVLLGVFNLIAPSLSFRAALPGLRLRDGVVMDWATTTLTNTVPGGSAFAIGLTWSMLRSFGHRSRNIGRAIVVTGVWDVFIKLGMPIIAVIWLATERPVETGLIQAAATGTVLFAIAVGLMVILLAGPRPAESIGRILNRLPLLGGGWPDRFEEMRRDTLEMLSGRWAALTFWTLAGHINLYLLLVVSLRAVGVDGTSLGPAQVLAAFAFGRLITALPITPGGLGVMELGLVGALGVVGDAAEASVVAAVLLFRFLNFVVPLPLGALSWVWWIRKTSRPTEAASAAARSHRR